MIERVDKEIMLCYPCVILYIIGGSCFIVLKLLVLFCLSVVCRIYAIITVYHK